MDTESDYSQENSPIPAKVAPKSKKTVKPLGNSNAQTQGGKAIEEIYQKKTQLEHILLRPDTYIGSTEKQQQPMWVHNGTQLENRPISYVPGLYKIFDEILVNAADNKARDATMDTLRVDIDAAGNSITVWNNGDGIPVEVHKEEQVYVPELIFGHLLTSSNYDDNEKKVTGGRNGYGAKLTNIFSTEFVVETADGHRLKKYRQVFRSNMTKKEEPRITACKGSDNYTSISFQPDLAKFGMDHLEADTVQLMHKRVYDMAGILGKGVKVFLNGQRLGVKSFQDYVELYLGPKDEEHAPRVYERVNDRWEVVISHTEGQFNQVSFVNSICTTKGGTHVNYLVDQVTKALIERITKKVKKLEIKPFMIKNHLSVFLNCKIENPAFDSQSKETLTLRASSFGSKCELPVPFIEKVSKIVSDVVLQFANFRADRELKKGDGTKRARVLGIPKLEDANEAGGKNSQRCTLILTEGDSAKTLAVSGLSVVGKDLYGVFPLRGKLLNVREASAAQTSANAEIQNIKQIMGLQHGKVYDDARSLRYGHLMIMTDQDHDGSHIKGLIMNFLHTFYPTLLRVPGFLLEFITPIVKATHKSNKDNVRVFYTMPEYEAWQESQGSVRNWSIKYYKGLGTSTAKEAKEYFGALDAHRKEFVWEGDEDNVAIEMAFSKKKIEERKQWLSNYQPGTFLDATADKITYTDFVNKELILFSRADLERSIPSMVDGLKPGQRKILFSCFKKKLKTDIKVAQLAGYVSEHSAYHHGETSLASTIVGLAQDFVGSNNLNLLVPSGMFGTRLQGGKDASSVRYIYTRLAPLTRHLFAESDDALLNYLNEEGQSIEPEWYMPILPMVLINGAEGIGTGWSTSIPNYNPVDIVHNLKCLLNDQEQVPMDPWYRSFTGSITEAPTKSSSKSYSCSGIVEQTGENTLRISELPVRKWTQDYKEYLLTLLAPENKEEVPTLVDLRDNCADDSVTFTLELAPGRMAEALAEKGGLLSKFKLTTKFATSNMMLFDHNGLIKNYPSPEAIVADFYGLRLGFYERRRVSLLESAEAELLRLSNKVRFILAVVEGKLKVSNRRRADIERDLSTQGFDKLPTTARKNKGTGALAPGEEALAAEDGTPEAETGISYQYLLILPIWNLTYEKVQELQAEATGCETRVVALRQATPKQMWSDDLDAFLLAYSAWEEEAAVLREEQRVTQLKARHEAERRTAKIAKGGSKAKTKGKKKAGSGSDEEEGSEGDGSSDEEFQAKRKPAVKRPAVPKKPPPAAVPSSSAAASAVTTQLQPTLAPGTAAAAAAAAQPAPAKKPRAPAKPKATSSAATASTVAAPVAAAAAAPAASRLQRLGGLGRPTAAAAVPDADDMEEDAEVSSPAPAVKAQPAAAAKPKVSNLGRIPATQKPAAAGATANGGAVKRKPKGRQVVSSDEEGSVTDSPTGDGASTSDSGGDFELDAPSPAVAPKGKRSKVGPSSSVVPPRLPAAKPVPPVPKKATTASAAAAARASGSFGDAQAVGLAAQRPVRARRAPPAVTYIEIDDSNSEAATPPRKANGRGRGSDSGSDFVASDASDD